MKDYLYIDIESRSHLSLEEVGLIKYCRHFSTQITCIAWAINNGAVNVEYCHGEDWSKELIEVLNKKYCIITHNTFFDKTMIEYHIMNKPWSTIKTLDVKHWSQWSSHEDTMALACYHRIGAKLEDAAKFMGLQGKFAEGRKIMLKQNRVDKEGFFNTLTAEEIENLKKYAKHDVEICRAIHQKYPPIPQRERLLWFWTMSSNQNGLWIDDDILYAMYVKVMKEQTRIAEEFNQITGLKVGSIKYKLWLLDRFYFIPNLQAGTVKEYLRITKDLSPEVKKSLELKVEGSNSSLGKVLKAHKIKLSGKVYETLQYHKAQTKRWSGKGIQPQNLPRSEYEPGDLLPDHVHFKRKLIEGLNSGIYGLKHVKNNIRRIFTPPPFKNFYCGDFSRIEPEVIFWLCGQGNVPSRWYEKTAASIYKLDHTEIEKDSRERHIGKTVALSGLYGQGPHRFHEEMEKEGIEMTLSEAKNAIHTFRRVYSFIPKLWNSLETAFYQALVYKKKVEWRATGVSYEYNQKYNRIELNLPSGGKIFYNRPETGPGIGNKPSLSYWDMSSRKPDKTVTIWGGTLAEHLVSGTAREVLASAIIRCAEKYRSRMMPVCCVHDEIWAYGNPDMMQAFQEVMEVVPSWAKGLRIKAECLEGDRYLK